MAFMFEVYLEKHTIIVNIDNSTLLNRTSLRITNVKVCA